MQEVVIKCDSIAETIKLGKMFGAQLKGGEVIELQSDLGGGKTTFVKGIAEGFGSKDAVSSPSFTINFVYTGAHNQKLYHFDFYRLNDPGIIKHELEEVVEDADDVVIIEWGEIVHNVLPKERITINIVPIAETARQFTFSIPHIYETLINTLKEAKL